MWVKDSGHGPTGFRLSLGGGGAWYSHMFKHLVDKVGAQCRHLKM